MNQLTVPVAGAELIRAALGYWPTFHDAEVLRIELRRDRVTQRTPPALVLELDVADDEFRTDAGGNPLLHRLAAVTLLFRDVADVALQDFNFQNVIGGLTLASREARIVVTLEPCFGIEGTFSCSAVEVLAVEERPGERPPVV